VKVNQRQEQIQRLRNRVDEIDNRLARTLATREKCVLLISQAKSGISEIVDRERERVVISNFLEYAGRHGLSSEIADPVIREIVKQCTIVQQSVVDQGSESDTESDE